MFEIINFLLILYVLSRVQKLEKKGVTQPHQYIPPEPPPYARTSAPIQTAQVEVSAPPSQSEPKSMLNRDIFDDMLPQLVEWFRVDWALKVGALFVLMGILWFVSYAFLNNWIGPVGRITLGVLTGAAIFAFGSYVLPRSTNRGEIIVVLGAAVLLLSIYSGRVIYDMYSSLSTLGMYVLVSSTVAVLSHRYNRMTMAWLSLLIAGCAPLITNSSSRDDLMLLSYILVITISYIWLAKIKGWGDIIAGCFAMVLLYTIPLFISASNWSQLDAYVLRGTGLQTSTYMQDISVLKFFAIVFTMLFWGVSLISQVVEKQVSKKDVYISVLCGIYSLCWIMTLYPSEWKSLMLVVVSLTFFITAHMVMQNFEVNQGTLLYPLTAISLLLIATGLQFEGDTLQIVLAVESVALLIYSKQLRKNTVNLLVFGLFGILAYMALLNAPLLLSTPSFQLYATQVVVISTLFVPSIYLIRMSHMEDESTQTLSGLTAMAGSICIAFSATFIMKVLMDDVAVAHVLTLIGFAITGLILYISFHSEKQWYGRKGFGMLLLGYVISRLLLVEVWEMQIGLRIVTFIAIGIILMLSVKLSKDETQV